jgi:Predicted transcriptional regulator
MKIKLTTDYAVRVIYSMYNSEYEVITSNSIAKKELIPHGVLMKVLKQLREGGVIASHQGRGEVSGGYTLAKSLKQITILEIVEIMEGPIALEEVRKKTAKNTENIEDNGLLLEYQRVGESLRSEMKKRTLYDILNEKARKR